MLEITVHHRGAVALRCRKPGENGCFFAEISGEMNSMHIFILCVRIQDLFPGGIPGTVVHENELVRNILVFQKLRQHLHCAGQHRFLIKGRNYN